MTYVSQALIALHHRKLELEESLKAQELAEYSTGMDLFNKCFNELTNVNIAMQILIKYQ